MDIVQSILAPNRHIIIEWWGIVILTGRGRVELVKVTIE